MSIAELLAILRREVEHRAYFSRWEVLDQSTSVLKARLYISADLFVQVYRNERFDTTNLVLIHNGQRIYARDQLNGLWHRHTPAAPHVHDVSVSGRQPVSLIEFLNEAEAVLTELGLP